MAYEWKAIGLVKNCPILKSFYAYLQKFHWYAHLYKVSYIHTFAYICIYFVVNSSVRITLALRLMIPARNYLNIIHLYSDISFESISCCIYMLMNKCILTFNLSTIYTNMIVYIYIYIYVDINTWFGKPLCMY